MAYTINSLNKTIRKHSDGTTTEIDVCSIFVEEEKDLLTLPDEIGITSTASTTDGSRRWRKDFNGKWIPIKSESSEPDTIIYNGGSAEESIGETVVYDGGGADGL